MSVEEDKTPAQTDDEEFEAAFNEIAAGKDAGQTPDPESEDEVTPDAKKDDEPGDDKTPDDKADPDADKATEVKAGKDGETDDKAGDEDDDPYAGMSDEVKTRFQALETQNKDLDHKLQSNIGRVSGLQRKANNLEKENSRLKAAADVDDDQPTADQITAALSGNDEDWDQFKEDYPAIASTIDKRLQAMGGAIEETIKTAVKPVESRLDQADEDAELAAYSAAVNEVSETYPEWTKAVKTDEFAAWLTEQAPGIAALASSDDPADASELISRYDDFLVSEGKPSLKATPDDDGGDNTEDTAGSKEQEKSEIEKRRERQIKDGAAPASKPAGVSPGGEGTDGDSEFEAAFNFYADKKDARTA